MQFKILTFVSLCGLALAAPQALVTRNTPAASSGSAVVADSSGNTRIFTQGGDGSILLLSGSGVNTGSNYKSSTVVGPNIARTGTPIAVVSPNNALAQVCDCYPPSSRSLLIHALSPLRSVSTSSERITS